MNAAAHESTHLRCKHMSAPANRRGVPSVADANNVERITPPFLKFSVITPATVVMTPCGSIQCRLRLPSIPISRGERHRVGASTPLHRRAAPTVLIRCGITSTVSPGATLAPTFRIVWSMLAVRSLMLCSSRRTCEAFSHPDLDGVVCRRRPHIGASFARQPYELPYERFRPRSDRLCRCVRIGSQRCREITKSPYLQWSVSLGSRPQAQVKDLAVGETIVPGSRGEVLAGDRPTLAAARCGRFLEGNPMRRKYSRKLAAN
jgi:hypothetical protein